MKQNIIQLNEIVLTDEKKQKLNIYQEAVFQWEKKTDLIGSHDKDNFFQRHILNGLNLLQLLENKDLIIHDIGTGAGIPGLICAICDDNIERNYFLFEKKYQKRAFLKYMIIKLDLKNVVICEKYPNVSRETSDVLTSRALLSLEDLKIYQSNFKKFVLFKGKNFDKEIKLLNNKQNEANIKIFKAKQDDSYLLLGESHECFT